MLWCVIYGPPCIIPLAVHFPHIVPENKLNELDDQWRAFCVSAKDMGVSADCVPEYWHNLGSVMDGLDNLKFPWLSHFMSTMTVLPHSSASVERIFSQINRMKTKTTNSLKAETVDNRLFAKQSIFRKNQSCCSWEPNKKLIREVADGTVRKRYRTKKGLKPKNLRALLALILEVMMKCSIIKVMVD